MSFEKWMAMVDSILADRIGGMTSSDLPDLCYRDLWLDGFTPSEAAQTAISALDGIDE
jgi:hypothetical protein